MALLGAAWGCGGRSSKPAEPVPAVGTQDMKPLAPAMNLVAGESMRWQVSLRGIVGGEATFAVGDPGVLDGKSVVITRSRVETVGLVRAIKNVQDDVITHIDGETAKPVYHHADIVFGDRQAVIETRFSSARAAVAYQRKDRGLRRYVLRAPAGHALFDGHSVVLALRAWSAADGERSEFFVASGRRLWRNRVVVTGREKLKTKLGEFRAIRLDGVARRLKSNHELDPRKQPRQYTIWMSADDARRPLLVVGKTEYGDVRAELIEHQTPVGALAVTQN